MTLGEAKHHNNLGDNHLLFQFFASLSAEAGAGNDDNCGAMRQTVKTGRSEQGIAEESRPFGRRPVAGQHDAALLIAFIDDVIEIFWARRGQRLEAKVIQDEQVWTQIALQAPFEGVVGATAIDLLQHLVGVDEEHVKALSTGFMGQGLGEMRLAHSGGATDENVLLAADIVASWPTA